MSRPGPKLKLECARIGSLIVESEFIDSSYSPLILYKNDITGFFEIKLRGDKPIYLNSNDKTNPPYIHIWQAYDEEAILRAYTYHFVAPYINCLLDSDNNNDLKWFEFRYESHIEKDRPWPEHHLHVFEGVPPKYKAEKNIDIDDFFRIIKSSFCPDGKIVDFTLA